jgi:hypothetical protein
MRAALGILIASTLAALAGPAAAATSCPPSVMDKGALKTADGGVDPPWARHFFRLAILYEGDPKHGALVTPREEVSEDRLTQTWTLNGTAGPRFVVCRYAGSSRTVQLALPAGAKRCVLVTMKDGDPPPQLRCD